MKKESGSPHFPVWLLGDSNPENWQDRLSYPLDARHPARHNIWTAVADPMQDRIFRASGRRFDTSEIYIRNAVQNPVHKPSSGDVKWGGPVSKSMADLRKRIAKYRPLLILPFGAFAFEFTRRTLREGPERSIKSWGARELGKEFRRRIGSFSFQAPNAVPLLHVSIARKHYLRSHKVFCDDAAANYFDYVGSVLAELLLETGSKLPIWI